MDTRKLDPTAIIVFHQAYVSRKLLLVPLLTCFRDVGEYLRDEVALTLLLYLPNSRLIDLLAGYVILIVTARSCEPDESSKYIVAFIM